MDYFFSTSFISENREYFDEIMRETCNDALYALVIYGIFIVFGAMIV